MAFKKIRFTDYPEVKMAVTVYEHQGTGALHYHTEYATTQNTFNVALRTLPKNSNGVAHILEHSVLNGSEKFPFHGVYFSMKGRNFDTYMNAMTGYDTTQYPFSTIDDQGYFNVMSVYLDAVFFPQLKKEVFLQEGWRYSFKNPEDHTSPLIYEGVVYNEMIGAYTAAARVAYIEMNNQAFKGTQYENFAGGSPLEIPSLSYEEFLDFHKEYYHPSNAIFYTFGSIPCEKIHAQLEETVLSKFEKKSCSTINTQQLNLSGQNYTGTHPGDSGYILFKNYQLPQFKTVEDYYTALLLFDLMQSGTNDFREVFLQSSTKVNAEHLGVLSTQDSIAYFQFSMDDDHSQQVESQLQLYWQGLYDNGIAAHELDNVFDFFELHNREGEAFTNNMGMNVIGKYNNLIRYGITIPEDSNSLDILQNIRQKLNDHSYLQSLLKTYFLDNKSTFTFLSKASPAYGSNLTEQINTQLRQKEALLTLEQKEDIISQNRELELFRLKDRNIEELPKLVLNDIQPLYPQDKKYTTTLLNNGVEIKKFTEDTNRVSYLKMYFPLVFRNQEELFYKKLAIQIMNRINLKGKTVKETSLWKQTKLGDLRTQLTIFTHNQDDFDTYVLMEAKGLSEYTDTIIEKTLSFTKDLEWSDVSLITNSINSIWRDYMNDYQSEAHVFAINESQAALSNHLALKKSLNREYFTQFIYSIVNGINDTINSEQFRTNVITKLQGAYKDLFIYSPKVFFCGDSPDIVESQLAQVPFQCNVPAFAGIYKHRQQSKQNALDANTEINYVAYSLAMPTDDHTDSGKLLVLAAYIHSYLITNVREKAGAYGVQASYNTNGIFTMFSYRDKKPLNTIEVFNAVGEYLLTHTINNELFNSSKLSLLQNFNKPTEAIHDAVRVFSNTLKKTVLDEKLLIDTALGMQPEELRDLAKKYFIDNKPSISVATNGDTIETSFADWTQINLAPVSDEL